MALVGIGADIPGATATVGVAGAVGAAMGAGVGRTWIAAPEVTAAGAVAAAADTAVAEVTAVAANAITDTTFR